MILGKEDKRRFAELQRAYDRVYLCQTWLSEFPELQPMWDFILGKTVTHLTRNGYRIEVMAEGDLDRMREKLRQRLNSTAKEPRE